MILDALRFLLTPLIAAMNFLFELFLDILGSAGLSVILVAVATALVSYPLRLWAQKKEKRLSMRKVAVDEKIAATTKNLKGEEKFRAIEAVYEEADYHPIQSIALGLPFFVMLPFLLSALFLFSSHPMLEGTSFLAISDLSRPDGLLAGVNFLPLLMTGITVLDSWLRFQDDRSAFIRFLVIASVLLFLVYTIASAIVLYWTISNIISIFTFLFGKSKGSAEA